MLTANDLNIFPEFCVFPAEELWVENIAGTARFFGQYILQGQVSGGRCRVVMNGREVGGVRGYLCARGWRDLLFVKGSLRGDRPFCQFCFYRPIFFFYDGKYLRLFRKIC